MPSDLSNYLATRYLVADPKKSSSKKRKRKQVGASSALFITDDDATWAQPNNTFQDEQGDDGPAIASEATADFRKVKKSNWKRVGRRDDEKTAEDSSSKDADAILAAVAAEKQAANADDDEAPVIDANEGIVSLSDGSLAGLQSSAAASVQLRRSQHQGRQASEKKRSKEKEEETVYRDATGRRVDVSMKRAEARRAAAEAHQKQVEAKQKLMGQVQLEQARKHKELLQDAQLMPLARAADDEELNKDLKEEQRWNDPMSQFMSQKQNAAAGVKSSKRRPVYTGAAPPNRHGIKPGYRWDGVDRGTGFEAERFKAVNRRERNKALQYSWQMDE
ncbi:hypothetical protein CDD81_1127 [Ophiocordyceps australis]|uniref:Pre-mRNA-splicing factor CWC26 n=1 Tax=Ophiocordyceps australis TaxID=1399860 RepID=A0A2C5Y0C3_9HYPO|nr:hypothetical protein CDD81_1127 [Ophiocordyceps australis]